jgi:N-acetylmuramoyl-L-alanine amidase
LIKNRNFKTSKIEKELFFNNLFKVGYSKKTPKGLSKNSYLRDLTKAFQRRFRQELINGIIDQECLFIGKNIITKYN